MKKEGRVTLQPPARTAIDWKPFSTLLMSTLDDFDFST